MECSGGKKAFWRSLKGHQQSFGKMYGTKCQPAEDHLLPSFICCQYFLTLLGYQKGCNKTIYALFSWTCSNKGCKAWFQVCCMNNPRKRLLRIAVPKNVYFWSLGKSLLFQDAISHGPRKLLVWFSEFLGQMAKCECLSQKLFYRGRKRMWRKLCFPLPCADFIHSQVLTWNIRAHLEQLK